MFSNPEQFSSATKALFKSQIATFQVLSSKTIEGIEKTSELNIAAAKASMGQSIAVAKQLSSAKDPQEFFSLAAAQAKSIAEHVTAYNQHLTNIASGIQAEFTKTAEAQFADTKSKVAALVEDVTKNAPAGSENAFAFLKSTIGNATADYENMAKATKQAVETGETQVVDATEELSQDVEKAASKAAKK